MSSSQATPVPDVWQDRELRFDVSLSLLKLRKGEFQIDSINAVEDTKGNNGERGALSITNLRIIWAQHKDTSINLSIGLSTITNAEIKFVSSKLRGSTQALHLMTKVRAFALLRRATNTRAVTGLTHRPRQFNGSRFEFIFTSLVASSPRLYTTVLSVYSSYQSTRLYRDVKLRGSIIRDGNLVLLPDESLYSTVSGVWNLSADQGNLGTFIVTNIRIVWFANLAENFNVSMPYLQIARIRLRDSKFGRAIVLETVPRSGGYVLGFKLEPAERLEQVVQEVARLHSIYSAAPNFGVQFAVSEPEKAGQPVPAAQTAESMTIVESKAPDPVTSYYADACSSAKRPVVFSTSLGLAIEELPDGVFIEQLWSVPLE